MKHNTPRFHPNCSIILPLEEVLTRLQTALFIVIYTLHKALISGFQNGVTRTFHQPARSLKKRSVPTLLIIDLNYIIILYLFFRVVKGKLFFCRFSSSMLWLNFAIARRTCSIHFLFSWLFWSFRNILWSSVISFATIVVTAIS